MPYERIDPDTIVPLPLGQRESHIDIRTAALPLPGPDAPPADLPPFLAQQIDRLAANILKAKEAKAAIIMAYGAHVVKNGCGTLINELIRRGYLTHLLTQGAGIIHDWEFAYCGRSSESVRDNAPVGRFGTWDETGRYINLAALVGVAEDIGLGESMGKLIQEDGLTIPDAHALSHAIKYNPAHELSAARADLLRVIERQGLSAGHDSISHPFKEYSISRCAFEHRVPLTVHPGVGYDIFANHPYFHGGAIGRAAGIDFHTLVSSIKKLSGGVYLSVGSAIMSPQVFEKAFSAANNILLQYTSAIHDHNIAIVDIQDGGNWDWRTGEPPADHPAYYLRFCKSFHRMGGSVDYLRVDNRVVLTELLRRLG